MQLLQDFVDVGHEAHHCCSGSNLGPFSPTNPICHSQHCAIAVSDGSKTVSNRVAIPDTSNRINIIQRHCTAVGLLLLLLLYRALEHLLLLVIWPVLPGFLHRLP